MRLFIKDFSALEQIQGDFLIRIYYAAKRYKLTVPYADKVEYKIDKFPTDPGTTSEEIAELLRTGNKLVYRSAQEGSTQRERCGATNQ